METCSKCGGQGHSFQKCATPDVFCNRCGGVGHKIDNCPSPQPILNPVVQVELRPSNQEEEKLEQRICRFSGINVTKEVKLESKKICFNSNKTEEERLELRRIRFGSISTENEKQHFVQHGYGPEEEVQQNKKRHFSSDHPDSQEKKKMKFGREQWW